MYICIYIYIYIYIYIKVCIYNIHNIYVIQGKSNQHFRFNNILIYIHILYIIYMLYI